MKYTSPAALPVSEAAWIMLKEVMPSWKNAAQFAVEIGLPRAERRYGRGDRRIFMGPVEPGAGQQPHIATVQPRMHAVAVELDFVQPFVALRCRVDQLRELRCDPFRQGGGGWATRYRPRHAGKKGEPRL